MCLMSSIAIHSLLFFFNAKRSRVHYQRTGQECGKILSLSFTVRGKRQSDSLHAYGVTLKLDRNDSRRSGSIPFLLWPE